MEDQEGSGDHGDKWWSFKEEVVTVSNGPSGKEIEIERIQMPIRSLLFTSSSSSSAEIRLEESGG